MARPTKQGLEYFSVDVDIEADDKVYLLEAKHGIVGFGIYIKLLSRIYKNSYYIAWTEKEQLIFSRQINVEIELTKTIVNDCINEGLFDINLYKKYNILTSTSIQKRFLKSCTRRKEVEIIKEFLLIDPKKVDEKYIEKIKITLIDINVNNNLINVGNNNNKIDFMSAINTQSKVKESKVKESKVKYIVNKTKLNLFYEYIFNLSEDFPDITEQQKQSINEILKKLDLIAPFEILNYLSEEQILDLKIQIWTIKEIYMSPYKVLINKINRDLFMLKYLQAKQYVRFSNSDEGISELINYFIICLRNEIMPNE